MDNAQRLEAVPFARLSAPSDRAGSVKRWIQPWAPTLAIQLLVSVPFGAGWWHLAKRTEAIGASTDEQREVIVTAAHNAEAARSDIAELRQAVTSHGSEETLFLKSLILRPDLDPRLARTIAGHISHYSELFGRDPNLVLAIIAVESNFNPNASSSVGAVGLMQVMPQWKKVLKVEGDLSDPEQSIRYGLQILSFYQAMYRDLNTVLTAYNRGPGAVDAALRRGEAPDNGYSQRVLSTYDRLNKIDAARKL
jgi:soluble lytic murein transglycosylase-like protein